MSELASALFSIADANEFRFARFYIVCEAVPIRDTRKSAHCLRLPDTPCGLSKRGKDTEFDVPAGREEILSFCFKESPHPFVFWNILPVFLLS